jgi:hypothetical protein
MSWLANPVLQGIGAVAGIVGAIAAVLSVPFFYRRNSQKNHSSEVVARFLYLFKAHGIERTQIPRFLGDERGISVADVSTDERLLHVLNEEILNAACDRFGVRRSWLDGADKQIYDLLYHYKDLPEYVGFIKLQTEKHSDQSCLLNAYKPVHTSADLFKSCPDISLVFSEPIAEIDQQTIYRYYPFYGPFPWSHTPARFNLYAFFTLAFATSGLVLKGYDVSPKIISELAEGKKIPEAIKTGGIWHPDDYAFSSISHNMPMDSREIEEFWNYINEKGWLKLFAENIITRPQ